jgi:C-terminal processing protease CtpA/Prc
MSNASRYIAVVFGLLREHYVFTDRVNWPALRARALAEAAHAGSPADTHEALRSVLASLGDPHTRLAGPVRAPRPAAPVGQLLEPGLAYLALSPPVSSENLQRYVDTAAHLIRDLDAAHPRGWVVDLRRPVPEPRPAAMWPMLTALAPLLGDGLVGGFLSAGDRQTGWVIHDGQIFVDGSAMCECRNHHLCWWPDLPVAVLTGPDTAGPAEAAVVAFRGRPASISIGGATCGLATSDSVFELPDGARLHITTKLFQDRTGAVHGGRPIEPDLPTGEPDRSGDPALAAARNWLAAVLGN